MKKSEWLGGEDRSPAVWIGPDGKGHISDLAYSMTDDAGRKVLLQQASALEAEHAELAKNAPPAVILSEGLALSVSPTPGEALVASADRLVSSLMEFVQIVRTIRDDGTSERDADVRYRSLLYKSEEE
ncbi:hypothetical protein LK996_09310 [Lysobacter sp. A6]|uniref:Uncharacterized protein n=1 Tax=Noviluteimonas lactosilytica TaxID=2888523 RepID=A0ABS8JI43_9GAMM|nr:hypothetical protein [Lysobacter lactosilyticus]MCC8363271.1 hypothetical protein [Lysobacter lactosilyticus]